MVVTPICPHLLTLRPIVVRGDALLAVRVEGVANPALLTVDGQKAVELRMGDELRCRRSIAHRQPDPHERGRLLRGAAQQAELGRAVAISAPWLLARMRPWQAAEKPITERNEPETEHE